MMKQFAIYDGVIFPHEKTIDASRKEQAVKDYKIAFELFIVHQTMKYWNYAYEKAENLVNNFGYTWEEVEELDIEFMTA